ncbi:hypothetical protein MM1S1540310_3794 [Mycobacteroides abscessus subsp. bolletii 1S-154-0310]|nr:hypothetical protein MBOL_40400 [Mycobacteroides abscessus subsp. bolletii BD]EIU05857.1 hypothetical protein MA5S0421_3899 [Mycobacteroides abscessus 5S-0421]EIU44677.1 hypothetical protein MA5S1215_3598 [Mycobacteroides abscessus 5S-1215]EIU63892.1 hypothetical protein MM1S1510930_4237 [Mycobacteroides abscessus subsp. bolletii 1S-151-0930]EIU67166.1 hypothetical protein MM1S1520914_4446 [Mycobacteroides abscessus subsp. bolletii 1S-152-0914]EIU74474.1 hypothetical protein MM1S1530915_378
MPLVFADQCGARALRDRLLDQIFLIGRYFLLQDDDIVVVIDVEYLWSDPEAYQVAFTTVRNYTDTHWKPLSGAV